MIFPLIVSIAFGAVMAAVALMAAYGMGETKGIMRERLRLLDTINNPAVRTVTALAQLIPKEFFNDPDDSPDGGSGSADRGRAQTKQKEQRHERGAHQTERSPSGERKSEIYNQRWGALNGSQVGGSSQGQGGGEEKGGD